MNLFAISALVNLITSIVIGFLILLQDFRSRMHITFFLFTLAVSVWSLSYFFWQISSDPTSALLYVHLFMAGAIFIPFFYFHFISCFLGIEKKARTAIILGYVSALFFSVINWTPLFISGRLFEAGPFSFWPAAGPLYLPFLIVWVVYATYPVFIMLARLRSSEGIERDQLKYILIGTAIGYVGGLTNYFLWYGIPVLPYGNISASIYILFVAIAILKYRLFNMKVIATELLVFALWLFIFVRMLLAKTFEDQAINALLLFVTLIIGVLLIRSVAREVETREQVERLAKSLERANERLKELDKLKSEFVSIASHQLRSPLTAIKGYASLLLEGSFGKVENAAREAVQRIFESSNLMALSVEDFLNVSRIEQGRMKYELSDFDMRKLVQIAVDEMLPIVTKKGLTLSFAPSTDSYSVRADFGKMKQVVANLIDNAVKYTPQGSIAVSLARSGGSVRIVVKDTGVGIPKDTIGKLFDRFVRAENANTVNVSGTGLGLYVAKQMVEAQRGKVWAESEGEGKGSTFIVEMPALAGAGMDGGGANL